MTTTNNSKNIKRDKTNHNIWAWAHIHEMLHDWVSRSLVQMVHIHIPCMCLWLVREQWQMCAQANTHTSASNNNSNRQVICCLLPQHLPTQPKCVGCTVYNVCDCIRWTNKYFLFSGSHFHHCHANGCMVHWKRFSLRRSMRSLSAFAFSGYREVAPVFASMCFHLNSPTTRLVAAWLKFYTSTSQVSAFSTYFDFFSGFCSHCALPNERRVANRAIDRREKHTLRKDGEVQSFFFCGSIIRHIHSSISLIEKKTSNLHLFLACKLSAQRALE